MMAVEHMCNIQIARMVQGRRIRECDGLDVWQDDIAGVVKILRYL
jgi:hypothetical protein